MIDLEKERLNSEIKRNNAETNKFIAETNELRSFKSYIKYIIMGIVAAGLLSAWTVSYMQPILNKNNELARLENKVVTMKNTIKQHELEREAVLLSEENIKIKNEIISLIEKNKDLDGELLKATKLAEALNKELKSTQSLYTSLSGRLELTEKEREQYAALAKQSELSIAELSAKISRFESARSATSDRTDVLSEQLDKKVLFGEQNVMFGGKPVTF